MPCSIQHSGMNDKPTHQSLTGASIFSMPLFALTCTCLCVQYAASKSAVETHTTTQAAPQAARLCPAIQAQQQPQQPTRSGSMPIQTNLCRFSNSPARYRRNSAPVPAHTCTLHSETELHQAMHEHQEVALKHAGTLSAPLLPAVAETPQQRQSMPHSRASQGSISLRGLGGYCDASLPQSQGRHSVASTGRKRSSLSLIPRSGSGMAQWPGVPSPDAVCQAVPILHVPGSSSRKRRRYETACPDILTMKCGSNGRSWPSFCFCGGASDAYAKECLQVVWTG